ncbi:hypothetical protein L3I74_004441 [Vibrio parahaemolyticus]|uniref:hypothetical protein n=1 Tax=Vibrio parahaemolyticus TaxID=670 RepID=UPI001D44D986|nr:hypothetical protein [Vibrio parahaemolyticus]EHR1165358.1 hypothetical protein [Vibrio parahaemolyticus]EIU6832438.1 hypothetical protein [Vibrio parahaemolyticus]EIU7852564.1 hypothetical protein [Vibrio parahaemolyticus]ELA9435252.1 hypothetical protein [Vibrio parahaemolyticus]
MKSIFFETIKESYYYELETRNSIFGRLQLNLAVYTAFFAVIAYMVRVVDYKSDTALILLFYFFTLFCLYMVSISAYFSYKTLTRIEYRLIPSADRLNEKYKSFAEHEKEMAKYNKDYNQNLSVPCREEQISEYLLNSYSICSAHNSNINEKRRQWNQKALVFLALSSIPLAIAASIFAICDLDASSPRKEIAIQNISQNSKLNEINETLLELGKEIKSPLYIKESIMCDEEHNEVPPPPPPVSPSTRGESVLSTESFDSQDVVIPNEDGGSDS